MKIALITDASLGLASAQLVKQAFDKAVAEQPDYTLSSVSEAETVVVAGEPMLVAGQLVGKQVALVASQAILTDAKSAIEHAITAASPWQTPVTATTSAPTASSSVKKIVAVTACPTGVAHTFMAAEAIEAEAKKRGWPVRVETRGSVGAGNPITAEEVAEADIVFIAADIEVDLAKFAGKPMYRTSTGLALKKTAQEFDKALTEAKPYQSASSANQTSGNNGEKKEKSGAYRHLLTGVSYMLPMVVAGGLCIALSFAFGINAFKEQGTLAAALMQIGGTTAFALMVPVLAGYIAFSIADRPGLTPGLIGGMLASTLSAGFLGGIIAGFIAGYAAKLISGKLKLPQSMEALKPILIIPLFASLVTGLLMIYVVGKPVAFIMESLTHWLGTMGTANAVLLGAVLGAMQCSDMGGPINKVAYAFGVGLLSSATYGPMAAIMAAGMVPPLAMGLATLVARRKFAKAQQEGGKAAIVLGLCYITEGAIPFAARDPLRVLPCCIVGGALTGAITMAIGSKLMAPHGGIFVFLIPGAITPVLGYIGAIVAGAAVAGIAYAIIKRPEPIAA
ncbi:PTS fructose transporter subunit IIBC [Rosenbergiella collisarenosi]|uniref:PTS fructose transporter subunit IIBC n=1 Tax=Rosenbergiella collisarenosi TaxID=1544695 RepID=UPI001BDADD9E|nr:PTS fructose transporter subunit IIBC [Rosenbergiella collisarenosi]MBT0720623.1 PTS fructose transporter subunit IIBC [Rosenbergiella collisarenosi]